MKWLPVLLAMIACGSSPDRPPAAASDGNAAFDAVSRLYLEDLYQRRPTWATSLGIHKHDDRLEDYSRAAVDEAIESARQFRTRVAAVRLF